MSLPYRQSKFMYSAAKLAQCPTDEGYEVAFAGRSNAGKSSALNTLTDQTKLARTSKTPGRTQLINYFEFGIENKRLVDLPGYGFAKVAKSVKDEWNTHLGEYLEKRDCLKGLVLLMDIRHPLKPFDLQMINWAIEAQMPLHIMLTKSDKLKRGPAKSQMLQIQQQFKEHKSLISVQTFSSLKKDGVEELSAVLDKWYDAETEENQP